jgi:peptidoglycan/LPS O-acetylase OafA/YrhL
VTFRPDIEGFRALSILFVVIYHYFPWLLPGGYVGVDVFFVISGYLITLSLLDHEGGTPRVVSALVAFWARRARRLLPNALLVLLVVSLVGATSMSDYALKRLGSDMFWSAAYSVNWLFILRSLDYLQWDHANFSVLLNFWSLAVEEQFYLVWPAVLMLTVRRSSTGTRPMRRGLVVAVALCVASLVYCFALTFSSLTLGFFSSLARAWELLAGASLALARTMNPAPRRSDAIVALALLTLLVSAVAFGEDTAHPGWPTLLPVAGAAVAIAFGASSPLAQRWLASRPMRSIGARSYSIYLWHWPVLALGRAWFGLELPWQLLLLAISLIVAELAYRLVERPMRFQLGQQWSSKRVLGLAVASSASVAFLGLGMRSAATSDARELVALRPSAATSMTPAIQRAGNDLPTIYRLGCHLSLERVDQGECRFGDLQGSEVAILFGDSHAAQWFPALDRVAAESGYRLHAWTKSSCPSADVSIWNQAGKGPYRQCNEWRESVLRRIETMRPRLVIVSNLVANVATAIENGGSARPLRGRDAQAVLQAGLERTLRRLKDSGATVVVIRDIPHPRPDIMDCLSSSADVHRCELSLLEATQSAPVDRMAAERAGVHVWDLSAAICADGRCRVIDPTDGAIVYRDSNHLTATFVQRLTPTIDRHWRETLGAQRRPSTTR